MRATNEEPSNSATRQLWSVVVLQHTTPLCLPDALTLAPLYVSCQMRGAGTMPCPVPCGHPPSLPAAANQQPNRHCAFYATVLGSDCASPHTRGFAAQPPTRQVLAYPNTVPAHTPRLDRAELGTPPALIAQSLTLASLSATAAFSLASFSASAHSVSHSRVACSPNLDACSLAFLPSSLSGL